MQPTPRDGSFKESKRISPVDRIMAELDGTYYRLSEVAKILNRSPGTIRRHIGRPGLKAPSYQIERGKLQIYLYTPQDIEELKGYFGED